MIQILDPENTPPLNFDPLDSTREWPTPLFPYRKVGEFILNENIQSVFSENEQIAFSPHRMVPGIEASDDKLLQARLIACNFFFKVLKKKKLFCNNFLFIF